MPASLLNQRWQSYRRLNVMRWNAAASGIMHRHGSKYPPACKIHAPGTQGHAALRPATVNSRGQRWPLRAGGEPTPAVSPTIIIKKNTQAGRNRASLHCWKLCPWIKHLNSDVGTARPRLYKKTLWKGMLKQMEDEWRLLGGIIISSSCQNALR